MSRAIDNLHALHDLALEKYMGVIPKSAIEACDRLVEAGLVSRASMNGVRIYSILPAGRIAHGTFCPCEDP